MGKAKTTNEAADAGAAGRVWTEAVAARAAQAWISRVAFLRAVPTARKMQLGKTLGGLEMLTAQTGARAAAQFADRAGVDPEVRGVDLRRHRRTPDGAPRGWAWRHRWVVRVHTVRKWCPHEQHHRILYRGPYVNGPADKSLLSGETVRGVTR